MALVLDWLQAEQPGDLVRQVVEALQTGALVSLPTEVGSVIAANAQHPDAVARLASLPTASPEPLTLGLNASVLLPEIDPVAERLTRRCWPGPMTLIMPAAHFGAIIEQLPEPVRKAIADVGFLGVWWPATIPAQAVLASVDFPVMLREVTTASAESQMEELVAVKLQAAPSKPGPTTAVLVEGNRWRILRPGLVSADDLVPALARWVVFVCTGNTCRSPMAEAICKSQLARRLSCTVAELPAKGYNILSAGVAAYPDDGAAWEAVQALEPLGADLSQHRSQPLTETILHRADHVVAMTRSHMLTLLSRYPPTGAVMSLLCGSEGDLDDPIGGDAELYKACAQSIARHVNRLITEWIFR